MNIFVAKLGAKTTSDSLRALFEQYGEVTSSKVIMDRETGNSKRYGFVEMGDSNEANSAISALNETDFEGGTIIVKEAKPRDDSRGGGGGYQKRY